MYYRWESGKMRVGEGGRYIMISEIGGLKRIMYE
jgi:hypothetical protein